MPGRLVFVVALAGLLGADERTPSRVSIEPRERETISGRAPNIRIDSTLVQINVTVTTTWNRVVTGL